MEKIKGSNATGLYKNKLKKGDISYYYTLKLHGKLEWFKVGLHSDGYRVEDARKSRTDKYNEIHNIEKKDIQKLGRKKRTIPFYDEVMNEYTEYKTTHALKTKYHKNNLGTYNKRVKPFIGHISIDKITKEHIENILLKHRTSETESLSLSSLNSILDVIRMVFNYAKDKKFYDGDNPTKDIEKYPLDNARERYLNKEEIAQLLDYTKNNVDDYNVYMCILLALLTGARMDVVVNIKAYNVDLKNKTIKLFDMKGLTDKNYLGYINEKYYETIKAQVERSLKLKSKYLLTDTSQDKYRAKYYTRKIQPIFDKLFNQDIDSKDAKNRVVPHTLRHTFGSQLVINGVDIYTVQKLMNHKDLKMTMRYAKLNDEIKKEGVDKLDF